MLRYFGIPYHEAPGEAEAECARIQVLGLVDAVWSQDSDCLLFGCTLWLYDHRVAKDKHIADRSKENTKKQGKYANMVRASDLKQRHGLDREGYVLFAMLVGGDYDERGLPQCGPGIALQAVRRGLGKSLCACRDQRECDLWSEELAAFLHSTPRGRAIPVPPLFPDYKILKKYYSPKVTSDVELLERSMLSPDYTRPISEHELLQLTSERFNIWGRLYMNWVGPVLLTRNLIARDSTLPKEVVHGIRLTKQRTKKATDIPPTRTFERKLTFSPFGVTNLCRDDFEGSELGHWNGDKETLFDEGYRVECEIPEYWLRKVLPVDVLDPPPTTPKSASKRKRRADDTEDDVEMSSSKRKRTSGEETTPGLGEDSRTPSKSSGRSALEPGVLSQPSKSPSSTRLTTVIELSDSEDEIHHQDSSAPSPRRPSPFATTDSMTGPRFPTAYDPGPPGLSIDGEEIGEEEYEDIQLAIRLSMQDQTDSPMPPSTKGKYDDIFAMRESGRNIQGSPVPAWEFDPSTVPTSSSRGPRVPRLGVTSTQSTGNGSRGTHANASRVDSVETPSRQLPAAHGDIAADSGVLVAQGHTFVGQEVEASAPAEPSLAEIRAARLRRFAVLSVPTPPVPASSIPASSIPASSVPPPSVPPPSVPPPSVPPPSVPPPSVPDAKNASNSAPSSTPTTVHHEIIRGVAVEVECIDLTDD
ncbi:hypothetical protein ACJBU6_09740 [Exserohilum turcicum]